MTTHPELPVSEWTLILDGEVGFRLDSAAGRRFVVRRAGASWDVEADAGYVIRPTAQGEGLVVEVRDAGSTTELGWTTSLAGVSRTGSEATLLLCDGRLFRVTFRGGRAPGFELSGWEVAGAYLRAEPEAGDWKLRRTPAGESLEDEPAILLLFGAIVADLPRGRTAASEDV